MRSIIGNRWQLIFFIALCVLPLAYPVSCSISFYRAMHEYRLASKPFEELGGYASGPEMGPLGGAVGISGIRLDRTKVTDADLLRLRPSLESLPNLAMLQLSETSVTDEGLRHLIGLHNLRDLYLWETAVTPEGVAELQRVLPQCAIEFGPYPK